MFEEGPACPGCDRHVRELRSIELDRDEQVSRATHFVDERNDAWVALRDIRDNFDCRCGRVAPFCQTCIAVEGLDGKVPLPAYLGGPADG